VHQLPVVTRGSKALWQKQGPDPRIPWLLLCPETCMVTSHVPLASLYLAGTVTAAGASPGENGVAPASSPLKLKLLSAFLKSTTAANSFPHTLRIIFDSVYGEPTVLLQSFQNDS